MTDPYVEARTDKYFTNVRKILEQFGDSQVTYAVFIRRRVVAVLDPMIQIIQKYSNAEINVFYEEGDIVPSDAKLAEIKGSYKELSELETLLLQRTGFPCVTAYNAYVMTKALQM